VKASGFRYLPIPIVVVFALSACNSSEDSNPASGTESQNNQNQVVQGPQGIQGERGPAGFRGERGATGFQGPQGVQGPAGRDGRDFNFADPFEVLGLKNAKLPGPNCGYADYPCQYGDAKVLSYTNNREVSIYLQLQLHQAYGGFLDSEQEDHVTLNIITTSGMRVPFLDQIVVYGESISLWLLPHHKLEIAQWNDSDKRIKIKNAYAYAPEAN